MISVKAAAGGSYIDQVEKFGHNYILPVIGPRRIGDLSTGMLQDVLNRSYKEGCLNPDSKRRSKGNLSRKTLQGIRGVEVSFVKWPANTNTPRYGQRTKVWLCQKVPETRAEKFYSRMPCGCCSPQTHVWCVEKWSRTKISMPTVWLS